MKRETLEGLLGYSGSHQVLLGFAPSSLLHRISFPDVLDEDAGRGYQRRINPKHSMDFRSFIQKEGSTTIPLTFNARPQVDAPWTLQHNKRLATLSVDLSVGPVLAQVDCQHRLGHLHDLDVSLPFQCFLGLNIEDEMEIFRVINSKAKGLSTSLLDYHEATLVEDLAADRPELFISLQLRSLQESPWFHQLDMGGKSTSGLTRRASLRTMQKAVKNYFLGRCSILSENSAAEAVEFVLKFWTAVTVVFNEEWSAPRSHLITKGIGVYALMGIAADIYAELSAGDFLSERSIRSKLMELTGKIDWSSDGQLKGLGGEGGAKQALEILREARSPQLKVVLNAK